MARPKLQKSSSSEFPVEQQPTSLGMDADFSAELIRQINKDAGSKVAFNLGDSDAPTQVHRWISTGSKQLDYIIGNIPGIGGGVPEGRIIEYQGQTGIGKSHCLFEIAKATQKMGGLVVYVDTENATSPELLQKLGINVTKQMVFIQENCTERVFSVIESTILKARSMKTDVPVVVMWDSVANTSPKAELEGEYDANTIGLQARVLGKGFRKITNLIAREHVVLVCAQQQREKIGVLYGDPTTTPGGKALPYAASVRIKLGAGAQLKKTVEGKEKVIGIQVSAKVIKNRLSSPFREVNFEIHFGRGIIEHEQVFDHLRDWGERHKDSPAMLGNSKLVLEGTGAWKSFVVTNTTDNKELVNIKFHKSEFGERVLYNPEYKDYMTALMDAAYLVSSAIEAQQHSTFAGAEDNEDTEPTVVAEQ